MTDQITTTAEPVTATENTTDSVALETTNPIKTTNEPAKVEVVEPKKRSIGDSIDRATAKMEAGENVKKDAAKADKTEVKIEAKADAKTEVKAASRAPHTLPPARFNEQERAEYEKAPESVKQGIHRAVKELEHGLEKYKTSASKFEELKEFEAVASKYGTTIKDALKNYVTIDQALQSNDQNQKLAAIQEVLRIAKVTPNDYAAFITRQPPEQAKSETERVIQTLQNEVSALKTQLTGVTTNQRASEESQIMADLNAWAADKPLANQLSDRIAERFQEGLSLDEAYAKAVEEFQEAARAAGFIPAPPPSTTTPAVHTLKGQKSITGAPGPGSSPASQKPSTSAAEAIERAFASLG
jgi:hypothetical protein